jgi:hypothetical protein
MNKKGVVIAGILALIFVPGTIPAAIAIRSAKLKKKLASQKGNEG